MHRFEKVALIAGLAVFAPVLAFAATSAPMAVSGSSPQICALQSPELTGRGLNNFSGLNGNSVTIEQLVNPDTLTTSAASVEMKFSAVCNYPHRIRIESQNNGLWRKSQQNAVTPQGFADAVPYNAEVFWGSTTGSLDADAINRAVVEKRVNIDNATAGDLILRLTITAGASNIRYNTPLISGNYSDTIRLYVEPR